MSHLRLDTTLIAKHLGVEHVDFSDRLEWCERDGEMVLRTMQYHEASKRVVIFEEALLARYGDDADREVAKLLAIARDWTGKQTLYVHRPLLNAHELIAWAQKNGFEKTMEPGDLHVTIAFSKTPVAWNTFKRDTDVLTVQARNTSVAPLGDQGAVVLKFSSDALQARFKEFIAGGASWDWPNYQPHVTITYHGDGVDLTKAKPYTGDLVFDSEVFGVVDEGWADKRKAFDESQHPRDENGKFTFAGGGSDDDGGSYEFVSPNVLDNLDFAGAAKALNSEQQAALRHAARDIDKELGIESVGSSIIGAWSDGAENSVMTRSHADWDKLKLSAAMKGYIADQKAVLVFKQQYDGDAVLASFEAKGKLADIHRELLQDGLAFHTLVPHAGGATVYVADLDGSAAEAILRSRDRYGTEAHYRYGRAEFVGNSNYEGDTDRAQRDRAREIYQTVIDRSPVKGSQTIWRGVRDRWSPSTSTSKQIANSFTASQSGTKRESSILNAGGERTLREWDESEHPRDQDGKFTFSGGGGKEADSAVYDEASAVAATSKPDKPSEKGKLKGKVKLSDFEKDRIVLGSFKDNKARADQFVERWSDDVGVTPAEFKDKFLGGAPASMNIEVYGDDEWKIAGAILDEQGQKIGTYERTIDLDNKTAGSDFFQLNGRSRGNDIGKSVLAGNVEVYRQLGIEKVKIHAALEVGGYAWAKYGYVPTRQSWADLSAEIRDKLGGDGRRGSSSGGDGYRPESWEDMSSDNQERVKEAWMRDTFSEFHDSEINNWRENGEALHVAKQDLAHAFDGSQRWAKSALDDWREENPDVPYTNQQILNAIEIKYEDDDYDGRADPDIEFNDEALREPSDAPPKEQLNLPGFKPVDLSSHLTQDARDSITEKLTQAFNDRAESDADDVDPPDHLREGVEDYQEEYWDSMDDSARYEWADRNDQIDTIPIEDDEESGATSDEEPAPPTGTDATLMQLASSSNPKAIWAIADSPRGKELLLGTDWYGQLDLNDKESMDRFNAYVSKGKPSAKAA